MVFSATVARAGGQLRGDGRNPRHDYTHLFDNLPSWQPPAGADPEAHLWTLSDGLYTDASRDNPDVPAGYTYFGQLISHDLTFDASPGIGDTAPPPGTSNLRTPRFDLDCLYGRGPIDQPYLYEPGDSGRLQLGRNARGEPDLLRSPIDAGGKSKVSENPFNLRQPALIGDPRNDENIIIAQLHLALARFHNRRIDEGLDFEAARRATRWHYQWVAVQDFLPRLCGRAMVDTVLGSHGRPDLRFFVPRARVPVEFSLGAYRMGHAMVRPSYALNDVLSTLRGEPLAILGALPEDSLVGGRALPPGWSIQWDLFVDAPGRGQRSQCIGPRVSRPLERLPMPLGIPLRERSLAFRTLMRGWQVGLPSGQAVARRMGEAALEGDDPLWIYVLKEAAPRGGHQLGPVAARLVAEVLIGLLVADPSSYLAIDPTWVPAARPAYGLADLLAASGVPITRADWERQQPT